MPRIRTSMLLSAGLALVLVASIACGSKKTEETPKTASTNVAATATTKAAAATAAATAAAKTGAGAGVAVGAALSPAQFKEAMCGSVKPLVGKSGAPAGMPTGMPQMPANMPTEAMLKQMVDNAPPELKADFAVFAKYQGEFLNAYNAAMTRAGGDMMKLAMEMANDPALMKAMEGGGADVAKASANIEAWIAKNC